MSLFPSSANQDSDFDPELGGLYRHRTRASWGLGTKVWRKDGLSGFQFQDGNLRRIADGFAHLLEPVDRPRDESERLQKELAGQAGVILGRRNQAGSDEILVTFQDQLLYFRGLFEGGFAGDAWKKKYRGAGARRIKRHRDPAIADASAQLAEADLRGLLAKGDHDAVIERAIAVLEKTSLVTKTQLKPLLALNEQTRPKAAETLVEVLYGEGPMGQAYQAWIGALRASRMNVSWALVTALPALVHPERHTCVRSTAFATQARWMAPSIELKKRPSGFAYERLLKMVDRVVDELTQADLAPTDRVDVYDFIVLTLSPSARKKIQAIKTTTPSKSAEAVEAVEERMAS